MRMIYSTFRLFFKEKINIILTLRYNIIRIFKLVILTLY